MSLFRRWGRAGSRPCSADGSQEEHNCGERGRRAAEQGADRANHPWLTEGPSARAAAMACARVRDGYAALKGRNSPRRAGGRVFL